MAAVGQQVQWAAEPSARVLPIPRETGAEGGLLGGVVHNGPRTDARPFAHVWVMSSQSTLARQEDTYRTWPNSPMFRLSSRSPMSLHPSACKDLQLGSSTAAIATMLRDLLAHDRILAARKLIDALPANQVSNAVLRRWRGVLAEPVVRRKMSERTARTRDFQWLRENSCAYTGRWVALADGELLAADESLTELRRRLRTIAPGAKPLFHRL